jgi:aconitase B
MATMDSKLAELVQEKQKQATAAANVDWDERRNKYVAAVNALYDDIEAMLADAISKKAVVAQRRAKQLSESYIGTYTVDDLILLIGDEQVRFSPRGRNIVAAEGRIDVVGERGEAVLVLQGDSQWGFVQSRQPKITVLPLDEAVLAEMLREVMRD